MSRMQHGERGGFGAPPQEQAFEFTTGSRSESLLAVTVAAPRGRVGAGQRRPPSEEQQDRGLRLFPVDDVDYPGLTYWDLWHAYRAERRRGAA